MTQGLLNAVSDWLLAILATVGTGLFGGAGIVKRNHDRSTRNERYLTGDDDDPNSMGVLQISKRNGEKIDNLERKMEEQHEVVLERVEELARDEKRRADGGD